MADNKTVKDINILLLGETGVGKSTFINGFANYLNYETLEEAENGETVCLIPTEFVITDENYKTQSVKYGHNDNESFEAKGQSVTQYCRAYTFKYGDSTIRLIDTPGVGDTRGVDQDKKNFEDLLSFIAEYNELHLICILLKPDMPRLTPSFQYCLKQLLCNLQKDASNNMVFVFTNTRQTFYRPKNTIVLLNKVLDEIKTNPPFVEIPVEKHTMYCLDNDSFQFLIAVRNGIKFADEEKGEYSGSWTKSVKECKRLLNYISTGKEGQPLKPHAIQDMLSINETRRLIVTLNKPIAAITKNLDDVLAKINQQTKDVENSGQNIEEFLDLIQSSGYKMETEFIDFIPIVGVFNLLHKTIKQAGATQKVEALKEKLKDERERLNFKKELLEELEKSKNEYLDEKETIIRASANFAIFLKNNAIATYNEAYKEYILEQIENLKASAYKEDALKVNESIKNLNETIEDYEKEKLSVENALKLGADGNTEVSLEKIKKLINDLYELKFTGKEIQRLHEESKCKRTVEIKKEEEHNVNWTKAKSFFKGIKSLFS